MQFSYKMSLYFFYTIVQKSKKMTKNSNQFRGTAIKERSSQFALMFLASFLTSSPLPHRFSAQRWCILSELWEEDCVSPEYQSHFCGGEWCPLYWSWFDWTRQRASCWPNRACLAQSSGRNSQGNHLHLSVSERNQRSWSYWSSSDEMSRVPETGLNCLSAK